MTFELLCLAAMTLFFLVAWLPASIAKRQTYGRSYLLSNRDATDLPPMPAWGERSTRAYENLKCYFPAFVVAVLVLSHLQVSDRWTQAAALLYVASRLAHYLFYTSGIVNGRAMAWAVGLSANIYLLVRIFLV